MSLDSIRNLVASDEIDLALDQLLGLLKGADSRELNAGLLLASRANGLRRRERDGLVSGADAATERNRLKVALLELADEALNALSDARKPIRSIPVRLDPPPLNQLEKIFGTNHLRSIAWLASGLEAAKSVCRIVTPSGYGSGFLVDPHRVMTCWHVIPDAMVAGSSTVEFNYEEDRFGQPKAVYRCPVRADRHCADKDLDFALVEIEPPAADPLDLTTWGIAPLAAASNVQSGDHVAIVQHPQGGPKQVALTANQVVNMFEHRLQYTTDTLPGSSGAPVFNDLWQVIAIHHAGGNLVWNDRGDRMFANEGILISSVLSRLAVLGVEFAADWPGRA